MSRRSGWTVIVVVSKYVGQWRVAEKIQLPAKCDGRQEQIRK